MKARKKMLESRRVMKVMRCTMTILVSHKNEVDGKRRLTALVLRFFEQSVDPPAIPSLSGRKAGQFLSFIVQCNLFDIPVTVNPSDV